MIYIYYREPGLAGVDRCVTVRRSQMPPARLFPSLCSTLGTLDWFLSHMLWGFNKLIYFLPLLKHRGQALKTWKIIIKKKSLKKKQQQNKTHKKTKKTKTTTKRNHKTKRCWFWCDFCSPREYKLINCIKRTKWF